LSLLRLVNDQWVECDTIDYPPRTLVLGTIAQSDFSRAHRIELGPDAEHGSIPGLCHHGQKPGVCGSCITLAEAA